VIILHTGVDYGFKLSLKEQFDYTNPNGQKNSFGYQGGIPETNDFRITAGGSIRRKRWTLDLNYKPGLIHYNKNENDKACQRILTIRVGYMLLNKRI
jgi:hypothetical protein